MFQPRFAGMVERGEKLQTVRPTPTPKRMPKPGDKISLRAWTGRPYRSQQRVLMESTITRVSRIKITAQGFDHWEDEGRGKRRNADSLDAFARRDGFSDGSAMLQWFRETHGLPFTGIVIHWRNV
jgi:hypothetical protein